MDLLPRILHSKDLKDVHSPNPFKTHILPRRRVQSAHFTDLVYLFYILTLSIVSV